MPKLPHPPARSVRSTRAPAREARRRLALAALGLLLASCAIPPERPAPRGSTSERERERRGGLSPALAAQRRRLVDVLAATPVTVETVGRELRLRVPERFAHASGQAAALRPLEAVLEQVAIGFKPYAAHCEIGLRPLVDPGLQGMAAAAQAAQRGATLREPLLRRGVEASRLRMLPPTDGTSVEIILRDRP
ncbi:hypothetical protein JI742_01265 [Piscinibacter sp. Jin2]|uniref:Uncharacterized protein n=1 Tax=Aquariibacter lacus TaxID=2801332 RepID=A0A9X0XBT5_9BURK|nr:hypothetical protein [Piscinibacter lacus]MBL0718506.1 hypothetical protein [Piscinibacter lacus]